MLITNNSQKNKKNIFGGNFSLAKMNCDISGKNYYNKLVVFTKDYFYHPSVGETNEQISQNINNNTKGFCFSLIEKDDFHKDGQYFVIQRIFPANILGDSSQNNLNIFVPEENLLSKNNLYDSFNNYAYGVMDLQELEKSFIEKLYTLEIKEIIKFIKANKNANNKQ